MNVDTQLTEAIKVFENNLPDYEISLSISHNKYKNYYDTVERGLEDALRCGDLTSELERQRILDTGELWEISWYPNTPVGFISLIASNLTTLFAYINENKK